MLPRIEPDPEDFVAEEECVILARSIAIIHGYTGDNLTEAGLDEFRQRLEWVLAWIARNRQNQIVIAAILNGELLVTADGDGDIKFTETPDEMLEEVQQDIKTVYDILSGKAPNPFTKIDWPN